MDRTSPQSRSFARGNCDEKEPQYSAPEDTYWGVHGSGTWAEPSSSVLGELVPPSSSAQDFPPHSRQVILHTPTSAPPFTAEHLWSYENDSSPYWQLSSVHQQPSLSSLSRSVPDAAIPINRREPASAEHPCPICQHGATRLFDLRRHIISHAKEMRTGLNAYEEGSLHQCSQKIWSCGYCCEVFRQSQDWADHVARCDSRHSVEWSQVRQIAGLLREGANSSKTSTGPLVENTTSLPLQRWYSDLDESPVQLAASRNMIVPNGTGHSSEIPWPFIPLEPDLVPPLEGPTSTTPDKWHTLLGSEQGAYRSLRLGAAYNSSASATAPLKEILGTLQAGDLDDQVLEKVKLALISHGLRIHDLLDAPPRSLPVDEDSRSSRTQNRLRQPGLVDGYRCKECGKSFSRSSELSRHLIIHDKRHVCHICSRAFAYRKDLARHMDALHERTVYACTHYGCGKTFKRRDKLRAHERHFHAPPGDDT